MTNREKFEAGMATGRRLWRDGNTVESMLEGLGNAGEDVGDMGVRCYVELTLGWTGDAEDIAREYGGYTRDEAMWLVKDEVASFSEFV